MASPSIKLYKDDLPAGLDFGASVAVDTETLGLNPNRDRLCLVQLSPGDGTAHLVQLDPENFNAPRLKALLDRPHRPQDLPLRALRYGHDRALPRRDGRPRLLHEDRLQAGAGPIPTAMA